MSEAAPPPMVPSHVFFGEMRGKSFVLPRLTPTKYARVSLAHTISKIPKMTW